MESLASVGQMPNGLFILKSHEGSSIVIDGPDIHYHGFDDTPRVLISGSWTQFYLRHGIIGMQLENSDGDIQLIPLAYADDSPRLQEWIATVNRTLKVPISGSTS